jgi:Fe-S-cluster-containing dehydrogenase component/CRP-like cAMP-binding protein
MSDAVAAIPKPQRWDVPFGADMTEADVDRVLSVEPFSKIDPEAFGARSPLREIIRNDCRIVHALPGDIVMREGDYGNSLFFILDGTVRVVLDGLDPELLGRQTPHRKSVLRTVARLFGRSRPPEYRDRRQYVVSGEQAAQRGAGEEVRVFLQDVPGIIERHRTDTISTGSFFGELAALARIPRTATVVAEDECALLEMRWQGFRDIRKRADAIRRHVDDLYRERGLKNHLRATPIFAHLDEDGLERLANDVQFETLGEFDWFGSYKKLVEEDPARRLAHEPIIAEEGHYPNGLIMVRTGFARASRRQGDGERTVSYLGRGHMYGFEEIAEAYRTGHAVPLRLSLRAVGYVDIIRVPTRTVEDLVLGPAGGVAPAAAPADPTAPGRATGPAIETDMLEFLVENRFMNGTATMLIDLDRCTGCDDCVRACADTHDGNPRFVRHGHQFGHHLVANACMHCVDPVCMIGCPTGAIHRSAAGGEVLINDRTCIGCGTCANSCPYHNIRMVEIRDEVGGLIRDDQSGTPIMKATKCDLSLDQPGDPPCQRACPHDALVRLDMSDTGGLARVLDR